VLLSVLRGFASGFVRVFTSEPAVVAFGTIRVEHVLAFQFIAATYEVSGAAMRGLGYSMTPTVITVFGSCILRIVWIHILFAVGYSFASLMTIYPVSWTVTGVLALIAYRYIARRAYSHLRTEPAAGQ